MTVESFTTNLNLSKFSRGQSVLDADLAANMDLIDAAIGALQALADGKIIVGNGAGVATDVDMSGDITIINTGETAIGASKVTNTMHAPASEDGTVVKVVAESNIIGGLPLTFMIPIVAGALGNTDVVMTHKVRVLDAYIILRGTGIATTTLQVFNGANAITDAIAASGSDTDIVRAAAIDDAHYEIAATGTLRVTSATGATQPDALVIVTAVRVT